MTKTEPTPCSSQGNHVYQGKGPLVSFVWFVGTETEAIVLVGSQGQLRDQQVPRSKEIAG